MSLEVEKELGKKGKKATLGSIQQAPELPTKTRTLRKNMDNRDGDSPGETHHLPLLLQLFVKSITIVLLQGICEMMSVIITEIHIKILLNAL